MLPRLKLYLLTLSILFCVALLGKGGFALQHTGLHQTEGLFQLITTLAWGFRFDLAVSAALALLAYLVAQLLAQLTRYDFSSALRWTTTTAVVALLLLHGADTLYYGEAGRHMGYELKEGFNSAAALALSALTTYAADVAMQLLLIAAAVVATAWLFKRFSRPEESPRTRRQHLGAAVALLPILLLSAMMIRGGTQSVPLEPLHAQRIGDPQRATLTLNGAYNALFSSLTPYSVNPLFAEPPGDEELVLLRQMYRTPLPLIEGRPQPRNVVVLLLESWTAAYMAPYGNNIVTTPNFDRLREGSITTRAMLAGGSRTTEGMFATFCSAQNPLGQTVAQSQLQNYDYDCLPELLRGAGWHTAFFQGTNKETSGTGSFAQLLGFRESYGKREIAQGETHYGQNSWGFHDPDIYRFALEKMRTMPRPFLVSINTNSTHDSELPEGVAPLLAADTPTARYQNVLHFADAALGDFIAAVRSTPGMQDTLFVLEADHRGYAPPEPLKKYLIPFAILDPQHPARQLDTIASQRDIAPTLLQLLNLPIPRHFSGRSLIAEQAATPISDYYYQGLLGWVEGHNAVEFPINAPQQIHCYSLEGALDEKNQQVCGEQAQAMQQRALAFTHTSQSLLFSGELKRFAELR